VDSSKVEQEVLSSGSIEEVLVLLALIYHCCRPLSPL
jgi:hypothetical protein